MNILWEAQRLLLMKTKKYQGLHLNNHIYFRSPHMKRICKISWHMDQPTTKWCIMNLDPLRILIVQTTRLRITEVPSSSCKSTRTDCPIWKISKLMSYRTWLKSSCVNNKNSKSKLIYRLRVRLSIQEWLGTRWALQQERDRHSTRRHQNGYLEKECPRTREATN